MNKNTALFRLINQSLYQKGENVEINKQNEGFCHLNGEHLVIDF